MRFACGISVFKLLCLAILLNSCASTDVYAHYDYAEQEGSGYYYKTHYEDSGGCNFKHRIGYKESFPIYGFPPEPHKQPQNYQRHGRIPPQQCVWEFHTHKHDNCTLEFHTHYFQRGDQRCEEQYLMIGDEYGDKKVCGYSKAPRRFISSGRKLFLGHFRQNGYEATVASSLRGVIRCVKRSGGSANYYNGSDGGCQLSMPPKCTFFNQFDLKNTTTALVNIELIANRSAASVPLTKFYGCPSSPNGCTSQAGVCFQTGPVGCNSTPTVLDPMEQGPGVECNHLTAACGQPGDCEGRGSGSPEPGSIDINCTASADQLCTFGVAVCVKTK